MGNDRSKDWNWPLWPIVPLYPYGQRRTLRREIVPGQVWVFEQIQGIFYVTVPIRMTVIALERGGLLVYAPVAPTGECLRLLRELVAAYGEVRFIIFSSASGIEHKVFVAPFARYCPQAQILVVPHTWSFPVNLPLSWLGLPTARTHILSPASASPLPPELDWAILGPITLGLGDFAEVSLFHNPSRSLLVTDALIAIPALPPESVQLDPWPLLFHARESALDSLEDTQKIARRVGSGLYSLPFTFALRVWGYCPMLLPGSERPKPPIGLVVTILAGYRGNGQRSGSDRLKPCTTMEPFKWPPFCRP